MRFLPKLLRKTIRAGTLTISNEKGFKETFGGQFPGPDVVVKFVDPSLDWKIFLNPELKGAEAYMNGGMVIENAGPYEFLSLFFLNKRNFDMSPNQIFWNSLNRKMRRLMQNNPISRSQQNVAHHYDLGNDFYRIWLDEDWQYSCGYFPSGTETLEQAQLEKKRHIAAKLGLSAGQSVLDIGSGWGGMALYLAKTADVEVTGVTLSKEQLEVAQARAKAEGLADKVTFRLQDYRDVPETFDRVVSVGMLEHVGVGHLQEYFLKVRDCLNPGGVSLIHSISTKAPPGITGPFIRKYIFPGGYAPCLSEASLAVERSGLWLLDCEIWRVHYAKTLRCWRQRFMAEREQVIKMYDERFARMWEFYLAASECAFEYGSSNVFQLQLGRERDSMPLHRDYLTQNKNALMAKESN